MKTNQTAVPATAKSNILQADPILLSVLAKLSECKAVIGDYAVGHIVGEYDPIREHAIEFDDEVFACISRVASIIALQIVGQTCNLCSHE